MLDQLDPALNGLEGNVRGPEKTAMEKTVIAIPLWRLLNMSAKTAPTVVRGQAPIKPAKNLRMPVSNRPQTNLQTRTHRQRKIV